MFIQQMYLMATKNKVFWVIFITLV